MESTEEFLNCLAESLQASEGVDVRLVEILKEHLLKVQPAQNAIALAKEAIMKLAYHRANPPKAENANG